MRYVSKSLKETEDLAKMFVLSLKPQKNKATVVCLFGDLGAGKTTFVQNVAKILGVEEHITSPTFVIMKNYNLLGGRKKYKSLVHIDAYRLEKGKELKLLGWKDIIKDSKNLVLIEWPENVDEVLPKDFIRIDFDHIDENTRSIALEL